MLELTQAEKTMFERGYVSVRMVAAKTGRHHVSIRNDVADHPNDFEVVPHGNRLKLLSLKSVQRFYGHMFPLLDFDNWGDVIEGWAPAKKAARR